MNGVQAVYVGRNPVMSGVLNQPARNLGQHSCTRGVGAEYAGRTQQR